jgi:hypothetical protein
MTARITRAIFIAAIALGILAGGAAPYGIPGVLKAATTQAK